MVGHNMSIGSKETCTYAPVLQPTHPSAQVHAHRDVDPRVLEAEVNDSARDRRGLVRSYFVSGGINVIFDRVYFA